MQKGDTVQIFREENDEWTLLGTAKVKLINGNDVTYESLPTGIKKGDIIVIGELQPVPMFATTGESFQNLKRSTS